MNTAPLTFSVITPCLNSAPFLEKALLSLFSQAGDFRIQSIIMDGGSTDDSVKIFTAMEDGIADGRVALNCQDVDMDWTSEKDSGQSEALNKALSKIHGDIVVWLNADDWFEPGAFQAVADAFRNDASLELVLGDCLQMISVTELMQGAPTQSYIKDVKKISPFTGGDQWSLVTPEVFFKAECIKNFTFDLCLDYFMDVDLWMHLFLSQPKWQKIDRALACFRWHKECKTLKAWKNFLPRLLVEDQILFSRYHGLLDVSEAESSFMKLMTHFITNWQRMGTYEVNNEHLLHFVQEFDALDQKSKDSFLMLYAAANETYR